MHTAAQVEQQQQQQLASATGISSVLQELPACSNSSSKPLMQLQHQHQQLQLQLLPQASALDPPLQERQLQAAAVVRLSGSQRQRQQLLQHQARCRQDQQCQQTQHCLPSGLAVGVPVMLLLSLQPSVPCHLTRLASMQLAVQATAAVPAALALA
jgi:hypothetical protein